MIPLWAIIKLTCKSAVRSHIFQLLLAVLVISTFVVPNTISGDGTAWGYIQISLKYSLGVVSFFLSLSTVWLGAFVMTQDVDNYRIHMVISKPISRATVWLGKFIGILLINFTLLTISATLVYGFIMWQYQKHDFSEKEKTRIDNEVMTARRVYYPEFPDVDEEARRRYQIIISRMQDSAGQTKDKRQLMADIKREIVVDRTEVLAGRANFWNYKGLPMDLGLDTPLFLRYRLYVGEVSSKDQRETRGIWLVKIHEGMVADDKQKDIISGENREEGELVKTFFQPKTAYPEGIMSGVFHEMHINSSVVSSNGNVEVGFRNFDPEGKNLFFQISDGPKLLIAKSTFLMNYCMATFVIMLKLTILAGIACAISSVLSMPTAIFMVISYIFFGSITNYIIGSDATNSQEIMQIFGTWVSRVLAIFLIPIQQFEVTGKLANGELIEATFIGQLFAKYFLLKALPVFIIGIWLYWRREMGLVIKK